MRKLTGILTVLLIVALLTACGGERKAFDDDMAEVRDLVQTAYDDGMREFTPQEHALGLKLVGVDRYDFDVYSDEFAVQTDHYYLFVDYADFASDGGSADFMDTLDKYATK